MVLLKCSHSVARAITMNFEPRTLNQFVAMDGSTIHEGLRERFYQYPEIQRHLDTIAGDVSNDLMMPTTAACWLLFLLDNAGPDYKI
jgi:hypothetical protein